MNIKWSHIKASFFGLFVIALCITILAFIVPKQEVAQPMWFFIFLALAVCAKFCWYHPNSPKRPSEWLGYIGLAAVIGVIFAGIDGALHGFSSTNLIFDLFCALCGGIVALSGFVRCLLLENE